MKPTPVNPAPSSPVASRHRARPDVGLRPFPLRKPGDYERALRAIEPLVSRPRLSREERDFLDIMATLIEKYEEEHFPIELTGLRGLDVLRHLLEANGLSGADLGRILGTRTQGYPILRGQRPLTREHMLKLGAYFNVPPGVFFGAPVTPATARAGF